MKKIATAAALFAAIGSGAALAQGAPPDSPSWSSSWPHYIESHQAQATNARTPTATRPGQLVAAKSAPVVSNTQLNRRGG